LVKAKTHLILKEYVITFKENWFNGVLFIQRDSVGACNDSFQHRIRQQIEIDDMQFGFMKGS